MLCWSSREEIPHDQGKRNPSKMVGVARGHQRADTLKPYSQKTSQSNHTRTTALSNSMKLSHARGATQDGRVMVERSDRMWSTGEGNGKPLQYSRLENPPYQCEMCRDESHLRGLMSPAARTQAKSREEAIEFIENYKQTVFK